LRRSLGFERIFLNCAACHVGTYRAQPSDKPVVVVGMPANHLQLGLLEKSLTDCALDERFNPWQVIQAAEDSGAKYSLFDRLVLQYVAVPAMRELLSGPWQRKQVPDMMGRMSRLKLTDAGLWAARVAAAANPATNRRLVRRIVRCMSISRLILRRERNATYVMIGFSVQKRAWFHIEKCN